MYQWLIHIDVWQKQIKKKKREREMYSLVTIINIVLHTWKMKKRKAWLCPPGCESASELLKKLAPKKKKKKKEKLYDNDDFYKAGEKKKTLESIIKIKNINKIFSVAPKLIWGFFFLSF